MRIDRVNIFKVLLPFTGDFSHSQRRGSSAKNVIVEVVIDQSPIKGYGEAAPRAFVTGETQESVTQSLKHLIMGETFPWHVNDILEIQAFVNSIPEGRAYNSAICAIEMALLDALGKMQGRPVIDSFPKDYFVSTIYYGAGVPLTSRKRAEKICSVIKEMRINKVKLKMGSDIQINKVMFEACRAVLGDTCDLRIDVNGAWDRTLALEHVPLIREYDVKVVEQPMMPGDKNIYDFVKILNSDGIMLMADEGACCLKDVEEFIEDGSYKMINIRLSKCGGFFRSLEIVEFMRKNGLLFQVGAQLGESGILSSAGRALSLLCGDAMYYEGSYDKFMLKENITHENVSFGIGGEAGPLNGAGLGVEVNRESLNRLSNHHNTVTTKDN